MVKATVFFVVSNVMNPIKAIKAMKLVIIIAHFLLLKDSENRFFMFLIPMKNASFSLAVII